MTIPKPQDAAETIVGFAGIKRRGRRPSSEPPKVPGRPTPYWGRNAIIATSGAILPANPTGPYSYYGYRLGRLKGESHGRAAARGANWEGRASASGIVGGLGALYLAGRRDKVIQDAWKSTAPSTPASGLRKVYQAPLRAKQTVGKLMPRPGRALAGLYRAGAAKGGAVRGVGKAAVGAIPALFRSKAMRYYGLYHAPGWAVQAALAPVAAYKWYTAKKKARQYWGE